MWIDLRFRLRALLHSRRMDDEMREEMQFHVEQEEGKLRRAGLNDDAAHRQARIRFGNEARVSEQIRRARGVDFIESFKQDLRYAWRVLRKDRSYTLLTCFTLALGIGASTAVFSLVNSVLLKPLAYPHASHLAALWRIAPLGGFFSGSDYTPWGPTELKTLKESVPLFQNLGVYKKDTFNLTGSGSPELLEGVRASAQFFPAFGTTPLLGRTFTELRIRG